MKAHFLSVNDSQSMALLKLKHTDVDVQMCILQEFEWNLCTYIKMGKNTIYNAANLPDEFVNTTLYWIWKRSIMFLQLAKDLDSEHWQHPWWTHVWGPCRVIKTKGPTTVYYIVYTVIIIFLCFHWSDSAVINRC